MMMEPNPDYYGAQRYQRLLFLYFCVFIGVEVLLSAIHQINPNNHIWNMDREFSIPTWISSIQLFLLALTCLIVFHYGRGRQALPRHDGYILLVLFLTFLYMAFDEMFYIHERLSHLPADWLLGGSSLGKKVIMWQILFAPLVGVGLVLLAFQVLRFRSLKLKKPFYFLLAGIGFWVTAFFFEGIVKTVFTPRGMYYTEVMLEEFSEMAGATCILFAFLHYMVGMGRSTRFEEPITMRTVKAAAVMGGGIFTVMFVVIALIILLASNIPAGHFTTNESINNQVEEYEMILNGDPGLKEIYVPLFDHCQQVNHYAKIVKWAKVYLERFPDPRGKIRCRLATSLLYLGNYNQASEVASELVAEFPSNETYSELFSRIERAKSGN